MPGCRVPVPAAVIAQLCCAATYDKWEALRKEQLLSQLPGLCYCPRCDPGSADYRSRRLVKTELCRFFAVGECRNGDCKVTPWLQPSAASPTTLAGTTLPPLSRPLLTTFSSPTAAVRARRG